MSECNKQQIQFNIISLFQYKTISDGERERKLCISFVVFFSSLLKNMFSDL